MPNLTSVGISSGVPNSGTGTVSTIDALMALVGEVQASPTSLTALDRLKTIAANIAAATVTTGSQASPSSSYISAVTAGDIANDGVDSGNPVKVGSKAIAGASTATLVSAADRVENYAGLDGVKLVRPHCGLEDIVTGNASDTAGTSTSCIASSGAGVRTYLTSVVIANTSANAITVAIKDGTTTKTTLPVPAGSGCIFNPPVPIPGTAATAWNFQTSSASTTVTCSMVGFKSKV